MPIQTTIKLLKQKKIKDIGLVVNDIEETESIKKLLEGEIGKEALKYIGNFINFSDNTTFYTSTTTCFNIDKIPSNRFSNIVNIQKINDIRWINKFFESVNQKIPTGGYFIGLVETYQLRNKHLYNKYPIIINFFVVQFNFFISRVFPKLPILKKIYFFLTKGKGRGISKAETLGRLVSCGFEIVEYKIIDNLLFFVTKKIKEPVYDLNPSYGPLFKMKRVGKDGKDIYVYKFRTMHPFAEYLQTYLIKNNGYDNSGTGKLSNDFRRTSYGKFLRKFWLDELPQIINVLKREMNIVGVRPLSQARYDEFPEDFKTRRNKYKPGCFPPYVALLMPNEKDNIKAERIYLDQKEKHPIWTDFKFFWLSVYNIVTNKIRSA